MWAACIKIRSAGKCAWGGRYSSLSALAHPRYAVSRALMTPSGSKRTLKGNVVVATCVCRGEAGRDDGPGRRLSLPTVGVVASE